MSDHHDQGQPTFLLLGASGGIGSELARHLTRSGARVFLSGRDESKGKKLGQELDSPFIAADATDAERVEHLARQAFDTSGRLDGIANCVGSLLLKPAHLTSPAEWAETISLNLGTAFNTVRAAGKVMRSGGSVVLVSSAAGRIGLPNHEAIAAAKAGVIGLTLSAAASYASRGLRVNAVAPGLVKTPMTARITSNAASLKASESLHALGRAGEPAEVAGTMAWLLGPESAWVTGQVFGIDGGLSSVRSR